MCETRDAHHPRVQLGPYKFGHGQEWYTTDGCHRERIEASRARLSGRQDFDLDGTGNGRSGGGGGSSAGAFELAEGVVPLLEECSGGILRAACARASFEREPLHA